MFKTFTKLQPLTQLLLTIIFFMSVCFVLTNFANSIETLSNPRVVSKECSDCIIRCGRKIRCYCPQCDIKKPLNIMQGMGGLSYDKTK